MYTSVHRHLGGFIFRNNTQTLTGCYVSSPGTHTYWMTPQVQSSLGDIAHVQSQDINDTKGVQCINYLMSQAFCIWDGGRLPTESEWEFVARGRGLTAPAGGGMPRRYPWGNDPPTCNRALTAECVGGAQPATQNVGALAARFVDGIADLAGNVAEYTASHFVGYDQPAYQNRVQTDPLFLNNPIGNRIARGGDAYDDVMHSRAASRAAFATADFAGLGVGLRCVRSLP